VSDPFFITGPALISFSFGRTSAYMLWRILQAHGGTLPDDVHVLFTNTGKELERSLRFGHECATRWGVNVHWAEYRDTEQGYESVGFNSASRDGAPFEALIKKMGYVPNRGAPYCSIVLKARTARNWVYGELGWKPKWSVVLGLRHDEQDRVIGALGRNHSGKDPWINHMPLDGAKVAEDEVMTFWLGPNWQRDIHRHLTVSEELPQGFDLGLPRYKGNCWRCWKKSLPKVQRCIRDEQEGLEQPDPWWRRMEEETGTTFYPSLGHADLEHLVATQPMMELSMPDAGEADEECGFTCFVSDADFMDARAA